MRPSEHSPSAEVKFTHASPRTVAHDSQTIKNTHPAPEAPHAPDACHPAPPIPDHELLTPIGRGSYGEVWLARNVMGTYRAIKIVYRSTFEHVRTFDREFNGVKKFEPISRSHDGLVDILQVGRTADCFFYVMELADDVVTGSEIDPACYTPKTLRSELKARGRLPFESCVQFGISLTQALGYMHTRGLIHRDIKPSNIIFVNGIPKLADIGLVAEQSEAKSFVGTEGFIPPEGPGTPQADLYSLGKVLYEMATGKDRHEFPALPTLLGEDSSDQGLLELNSVFLKACQVDSRRRYPDAAAMRDDLLLMQSGKSVARAQAVERRLALVTRVSVVGGILTLLILAGLYYVRQQSRRETELRRRAVAGEASARQNLYVAEINLAHRALESGNLGHGVELLKRQLPKPGEPDARGFEWRYLWQRCQGESLHTFDAAGHAVCSALFSPDGRLLATASLDNLVRVYDAATHRPVTNFPGLFSTYGAPCLAFAPDGAYLAVAGKDKVTVRETAHWTVARELEDESLRSSFELPVVRVAFSPDGKRLATFGDAGRIVLWSTETWERMQTFDFSLASSPMSFSPDSQSLVVAGPSDLTVIELTKSVRRVIPTDLLSIDSLAVSSKWIVAGSYWNGNVRLWNFETAEEMVRFRPHPNFVFALAFSPDERTLATGGGDQVLHFWDLSPLAGANPQERGPPRRDSLPKLGTLTGHWHEVWSAHYSSDGRLLVSSSKDGTARLWRTDRRREEPGLANTWRPLWFSPDGARLITVNSNQTLRLWDVATRTELNSAALQVTTNTVTAQAISTDGKQRALGLANGSVEIWRLAPRERRATLKSANPEKIESLLFSSTGQYLAADMATPSASNRFPTRRKPRVATRVWTLGDQREHLKLDHTLGALGFSPDEKLLVVRGPNYSVEIWDLGLRIKRAVLTGHQWRIHTAVFSPDRRWMVTPSYDNTVRVWEVATWTERAVLRGYMGGVGPAFFSADGKTLFTGCTDQSIKLWNIATGQELLSLQIAPLDAYSLLVSPDGHTLALGSSFMPTDHGEVRLLQAPSFADIEAASKSR